MDDGRRGTMKIMTDDDMKGDDGRWAMRDDGRGR